jgi:hypothetical protein
VFISIAVGVCAEKQISIKIKILFILMEEIACPVLSVVQVKFIALCGMAQPSDNSST